MPNRIQRKRTKGWRVPEGAVYVGRPTKWGNPYFIVSAIGDAEHKRKERQAVVDKYRGLMEANQHPATAERWRLPLHELRGKDLMCWCPIDQPCHADVLLEMANR